MLKQALALVEIKSLDHFVVGGSQVVSFAEQELFILVAIMSIPVGYLWTNRIELLARLKVPTSAIHVYLHAPSRRLINA